MDYWHRWERVERSDYMKRVYLIQYSYGEPFTEKYRTWLSDKVFSSREKAIKHLENHSFTIQDGEFFFINR